MISIFFFGLAAIQAKLYPSFTDRHISHFIDSEKKRIRGRVVSFSKHYPQKTRMVIECSKLFKQDEDKDVYGRINLTIYGDMENQPLYGDLIEFESKIKAVRNFGNPGGFDYKRFLMLQDIYGSAWTSAGKVRMISDNAFSGPFNFAGRQIESVRNGFSDFILDRVENPEAAAVMISLTAGKKEMLKPETRDLFSAAGISHLLAISGLHLSIVYILFFMVFYRVLALSSFLSVSGSAKKMAGLASLLPLSAYAVLTGFSPSTQRALIMVAVIAVSYTAEREKDVVSSLSAAGIIILLADAAALFAVSFQLSFMAVIFIVTGYSLIKQHQLKFENPQAIKIFMLLAITFFAGLGTSPLTAYYFNIVSLAGLISNLIFIPLIGFIVLPTGLIALGFFEFLPGFASVLIQVCGIILDYSFSLSEWIILLPYSSFRVATPGVHDVLILYLLFAGFFLIFRFKKAAGIIIVSSILLLKSGLGLFEKSRIVQNTDQLKITVLDVGQGNSALITTPQGKQILVDGGGFSSWSTFDTGRFIVAPFLWQQGITHLDYVILSHPESDHLNGLVFILKNFSVGTLVKNTDKTNKTAFITVMQTCRNKKIQIWYPSINGPDILFDDVKLIFNTPLPGKGQMNLNDNSVVFKLVYEDFSILFPGDVLKKRENQLSKLKTEYLDIDVFLSPHHGSNSSSSKVFLEKLSPQSVIISCGWENRYGFPHEKVLDRYRRIGAEIYRTDQDGAVTVISNGQSYNILTYKGG